MKDYDLGVVQIVLYWMLMKTKYMIYKIALEVKYQVLEYLVTCNNSNLIFCVKFILEYLFYKYLKYLKTMLSQLFVASSRNKQQIKLKIKIKITM